MANAYNVREPIATTAQNYKLKFEVEEIPGYTKRSRRARRSTKEQDGHDTGLIFELVEVVVPEAWDIYFPGGHMIRVEHRDEMYRLGFMTNPSVIDMETGDEVQVTDTLSPKEIVKRQQAASARRIL